MRIQALALLHKLLDRAQFYRDPIAYHRAQGVRIGENVDLYGATPTMFGSEPYLVTICDDVTISYRAEFVTHDGGLRVIRDRNPGAFYYAPITVGPRAFIGAGAWILPGVTIGPRAVVGAGSVVTRDVAAGTVVAGVPAKYIKTVSDYGYQRRESWVNTSRLSSSEKEATLRKLFDLPR